MPREGHDNLAGNIEYSDHQFQSTCPARGTTRASINNISAALFQSTCPARGTTSSGLRVSVPPAFQSTCPARGTTELRRAPVAAGADFNPRAPRGARPAHDRRRHDRRRDFNPRAPRGARPRRHSRRLMRRYFNPRAPRGARRQSGRGALWLAYFNPRAPRGARLRRSPAIRRRSKISIHVPREGHDPADAGASVKITVFQSTCPARGTTPRPWHFRQIPPHFNPRAPRGARLRDFILIRLKAEISIHVPREGHDGVSTTTIAAVAEFQSTCPARGTTKARLRPVGGGVYFNPRAPRGARRRRLYHQKAGERFQSTCPARGTTANMHNFFVQICARVTNIPLKGMPYLQKTYVSI